MIKEIKFTDKALKQIENLLSKKDKGSFFRIAIKGGGCSGFQYEFTFDKSKQMDDLYYQNILIDKTSADGMILKSPASIILGFFLDNDFNCFINWSSQFFL